MFGVFVGRGQNGTVGSEEKSLQDGLSSSHSSSNNKCSFFGYPTNSSRGFDVNKIISLLMQETEQSLITAFNLLGKFIFLWIDINWVCYKYVNVLSDRSSDSDLLKFITHEDAEKVSFISIFLMSHL